MTLRRVVAVLVGLALCLSLAPVAAAPAASKKTKTSATAKAKAKCKKKKTKKQRAACLKKLKKKTAAKKKAPSVAPKTTAPTVSKPASPSAPSAPSTPSNPAPSVPAAPVNSTIGVTAHDFGTFVLRTTKTEVPAGNLTVYFRNVDSSEHNLFITPVDATGDGAQISEAIEENGIAQKTVPVTKGTWRLFCSIQGHESMKADVSVK